MKLLNDVLKRIKPENKKKIMEEVDCMLKKINKALEASKIKAKATTGGSIAKDTFLAGDHDCDIFVKFNYNMYKDKSSELSDMLEKALKKIVKGKASNKSKASKKLERLHGSRDYFQIKNDITFEIVPVLDLDCPLKAMNITDCSPLHVKWVKKFPKMKDEIRLAKAFAKANKVYGAESYKKGFSGHVIDIITINSGGFMNLLKDSKKWKKGYVIDYYNVHKGKAHRELNQSKLQSAIIVIDPVEPSRNASAALSNEKLELFKKKAKEFLKKPDETYFIKKKIDIEKIKKKYSSKKLIVLDIASKKGKEDVVGAKLMKTFEYISKQLKKNEFLVVKAGWEWDKKSSSLFYFVFDKKPLSKDMVVSGPPLNRKEHVKAFKKKYKTTFEKNKKIHANAKRKYVLPEKFIKSILDDKYIKEKVKKIVIK